MRKIYAHPMLPSKRSFTASTTVSTSTNYGDDFYALTDYQAENYRVVKFEHERLRARALADHRARR